MSFDIKYDRNGMALPSVAVENAIQAAQPAPIEQPQEQLVENQTQNEPELVENQTEDVVIEETTAVSAPAETPQAKNFRAIKDRAERAERERDEYFRMLSEEKMVKPTPKSEPEPEEDLNYNLEADALVEGKHLSKVDKKIQLLEKKLAQYERRSTETTAESRIRSEFPDYYAVVNKENMATLSQDYPELTQGIINTNDIYAKAKATYMLIKKFGIAEDPVVTAEKAIVIKNASKPRPLASVSPQQGATPLSQANAFANGLTKNLKEQLQAEMAEARRNM